MLSALSANSGAGAWSTDLNLTPTAGTGTAISIGPGTPAAAGELFIGGVGVASSASGDTLTQPGSFATPFDAITQSGGGKGLRGGNWVNPAATAVTYNPTNSASRPWCAFLLSFKAAAAGASFAASTGSFTLTGEVATFAIGIPANFGAFVLTGESATFSISSGMSLSAGTGVFALTGDAAIFAAAMPAAFGAYALSAGTTSFTHGTGSVTVSLAAGFYQLNGTPGSGSATFVNASPGTPLKQPGPLPPLTAGWVNTNGAPTQVWRQYLLACDTELRRLGIGNIGPLTNAANDAAAAMAGVPVGGLYENSGTVLIRKM